MATFYTKWCFSGTNTPNNEKYTINGENVTMYNDVRFKFVVSEKVNTSANTSTLVVDKYACFYWTWDNSAHFLDITMRSKIPSSASYKSETASVRNTSASSDTWTYVGQDSFTVKHNADGSGSTTFTGNGYYKGGSGTTYSKSVSATINLTKINRASTITTDATTSAGKLFGDTATFNITKKDSSFTHDLTFISGGTTYTIAENVDTGTTYTFPATLIKNYPNAVKNGITVTCTTYKGDTKIGTSNCTVYLSVPEEYVPTCSLALQEANETMLGLGWGVYVKGKSQVKGIITAAGVEGSTIKSYTTTGNKQTFSTSEFTTGLLIESVEAMEFITSVADTRGRTATDTKAIEVIDYKPPTISNVQIERCNADGSTNNEGTYGKAIIEYSIAPITDLNEKTIRITYADTVKEITPEEYNGKYIVTELFEGLETTGSYDFLFELIDTFDTVPMNYTLPPAFVTRSFLAGGKGVSIGQIATVEGFHSHMDSEFHKNTKVKNININGLKIEKMNVGGWICYAEDEA